ncbi:MAG TPA: hypothetical protein VFN10_07845 [Thermoanaerobaculia bacterium]|nr:hypothetical protein [Thermoanaerobaculia bacterium]
MTTIIDLSDSPYNVVGDGSDYTTELQQALNDAVLASGQGGIVIAPPGQIGLSAKISRPRGVSLWGSGTYGTEFLVLNAIPSSAPLFDFDDTSNEYNVADQNYYINGNSVLVDAIDTRAKNFVAFRNIRIASFSGVGIHNGSYFNRYEHVLVAGNGKTGTSTGFKLDSNGASSAGSNGVVLDQCWAQLCAIGVSISGDATASSGITLRSMLVDQNTTGVLITDGANPPSNIFICAGSRFEDNTTAINVNSVGVNVNHSGLKITETAFSGTCVNFIILRGADASISNCTFAGATSAHVRLDSDARRTNFGPGNSRSGSVPFIDDQNASRLLVQEDSFNGVESTRRLLLSEGTAITTADVTLTGFGSSASVTGVSGDDSRGRIFISSAGTGQTANATIAVKIDKDGAWPTAPFVQVARYSGNQLAVPLTYTVTTTTITITFNGTPVAGESYAIEYHVVG